MESTVLSGNGRGVSPVVGVALLIGITVILATVIGAAVFVLDMGEAEAPDVSLSFTTNDANETVLIHEGGEPLDADEIVVLDQDGDKVNPGLQEDLTAGERVVIVNDSGTVEEVQVVWESPNSDAASILANFRP